MARIDDVDVYNPFGWRLAELADPATTSERCDTLLGELLVWEAEEVAHGHRHVTIVHGDPDTVDAARHLSAFYETIRDFAEDCSWVRVRGEFAYVTVTVRGPDADEQIREVALAAAVADPGDWTVMLSAFPPVS
jgi:hypothetical protein